MTDTATNGSRRPTFELSVDTRIVRDRLAKAAIGETVTYTELSDALGRKVGGGSPHIQSAVRSLETDGVIFGNIRGVGYQRLADAQIVDTVEHERKGLRRRARRIVHRLTSIGDFDGLPNASKIKHNAAVSAFGAIAAMLSPGKMKTLETTVESAQAKLPLAKTLEAFK